MNQARHHFKILIKNGKTKKIQSRPPLKAIVRQINISVVIEATDLYMIIVIISKENSAIISMTQKHNNSG